MIYDKKIRLPIWRDSNLLLLQIEQAVRKFPKHHKFTIGSDLRKQAMLIVRYLAKAVSAKNQLRLRCVSKPQSLIDEIKVMINLAKELKVILSIYWGHFKNANHWRLQKKLLKKFWWLNCFFMSNKYALTPLWESVDAYSYNYHKQYFMTKFPNATINIQKGYKFQSILLCSHTESLELKKFTSLSNFILSKVTALTIIQHGYIKSGLRHRIINSITLQM